MPTNAAQHIIYSNHRIEAPDGTLLCRAGKDRTDWYLQRNLAEIVKGTDPFTIRLNFEPSGRGNVGDEFYLADKLNQCVACGFDEAFNQHHVVPRCYRRYFPTNYKGRSSHDVVILCLECHAAYEKEADLLKQQIGKEMGFSFLHKSENSEKDCAADVARYAARTLIMNRSRMPQERILELEAVVAGYIGKDVTEALLDELAGTIVMKASRRASRRAGKVEFRQHAEYVVSQIDIDSLIYRWRQHFVSIMNPKFLPTGWAVNNPTCTL